MIPNGEGYEATFKGRWHYFAVKKLSPSLRGRNPKHYGSFYCLNCLHPFRTKNKVDLHKKIMRK